MKENRIRICKIGKLLDTTQAKGKWKDVFEVRLYSGTTGEFVQGLTLSSAEMKMLREQVNALPFRTICDRIAGKDEAQI